VHGTTKTAILLDKIKELGFKYSTKGAITISISDMVIPEVKAKYIKKLRKRLRKLQNSTREDLYPTKKDIIQL